MIQLVYWSQTGITKRVAEKFGGIELSDYENGPYVLILPSYGSPRTGNYVPTAVKKHLAKHGDCLVGVIGVGNSNFGPDFCKGAWRVSRRFKVPLLLNIDMVPTTDQAIYIEHYLKGD